MKTRIFLFTIFMLGTLAVTGYSQGLPSLGLDAGIAVRNPFKPWLPEIEKKAAETPQGTNQGGAAGQGVPEIKIEIITPPALKISGIIWNTKKPQAIINNTVVSIGDTIENSKIVDIRKEGVDIIYSEKLFTIPIEQALAQST